MQISNDKEWGETTVLRRIVVYNKQQVEKEYFAIWENAEDYCYMKKYRLQNSIFSCGTYVYICVYVCVCVC